MLRRCRRRRRRLLLGYRNRAVWVGIPGKVKRRRAISIMYANGESDTAQRERLESMQHALCVGFPPSAAAHMVFVPVTL